MVQALAAPTTEYSTEPTIEEEYADLMTAIGQEIANGADSWVVDSLIQTARELAMDMGHQAEAAIHRDITRELLLEHPAAGIANTSKTGYLVPSRDGWKPASASVLRRRGLAAWDDKAKTLGYEDGTAPSVDGYARRHGVVQPDEALQEDVLAIVEARRELKPRRNSPKTAKRSKRLTDTQRVDLEIAGAPRSNNPTRSTLPVKATTCACKPYVDILTFAKWAARSYTVRKGQHGKAHTVGSRTVYLFCRCQVDAKAAQS